MNRYVLYSGTFFLLRIREFSEKDNIRYLPDTVNLSLTETIQMTVFYYVEMDEIT